MEANFPSHEMWERNALDMWTVSFSPFHLIFFPFLAVSVFFMSWIQACIRPLSLCSFCQRPFLMLLCRYIRRPRGYVEKCLAKWISWTTVSEVSRISTNTNPVVFLKATTNATALFIATACLMWKIPSYKSCQQSAGLAGTTNEWREVWGLYWLSKTCSLHVFVGTRGFR